MSRNVRIAIAAAMVLGSSLDLLALGCQPSSPPKAPCATAIVALYTAEMIAAGCKGEHFDDPQCAAIKERRNAREREAGCK